MSLNYFKGKSTRRYEIKETAFTKTISVVNLWGFRKYVDHLVWLTRLVQKLCDFCGLGSEFSSFSNLSFFFLSFLFHSSPYVSEVLQFSMFWILLALIQSDMLAQFDFFDWTPYSS